MLVALYTATIFVSSALLFLIQPMVAKMVLPQFGGVPAVWTTSMVFFQAALLCGYLYAHAAISRLGIRRQALVHLGVLAVPAAFLPLAIASGWSPSGGASPVPALLGVLTVSAGAPFFVVAASGPMLQRWFSATGHRSAGDPYFLYAASNLGSLLGLLAYPALIEPLASLQTQSRLWSAGYALLAALIGCCALTLRRRPATEATTTVRTDRAASDRIGARRRLRWVALAFVPTSLMLGATAHLSNDIAPVPLLWVVPLSLYLLTFVFAFGRRTWIRHEVMVRTLPFALLPLALLIGTRIAQPVALPVVFHLATFFVAAMICHGELARDRPPPERLTEFFLLLSLGGVLGGIANAVVAPVLFESVAEYPVALVLAAACRRVLAGNAGPERRRLDVAFPVVVGVATAVIARALGPASSPGQRMLLLGIPTLVVFSFGSRRLRFALGVAGLLIGLSFYSPIAGREIHRERTFFGVHRVVANRGFNLLIHGNIVHGSQRRQGEAAEPLTYYHRASPIADVLAEADDPNRRVAVVGLGTGSLACYGSPEQQWTFFEIDPEVERIARDPRLFTFLRDCPTDLRVVLGDARLSLADEPSASYDVIVVDAFNSDAIPVHLMTREAVRLYLSKLRPGGLLSFHISNRYLDLEPVMSALADDAGLAGLRRFGAVTASEAADRKLASRWVAMARSPADLGSLAADERWRSLGARRTRVWTDHFSNILSVFDWG